VEQLEAQLNRMESKMKTIKHSLEFVTELDESDPTAKRLLSLTENESQLLLKSMLVNLFSLDELIEKVNENNSWAKLKLIK
jgi:hypothetical protein